MDSTDAPSLKTSTISADDADTYEIDFAIDTALSWDGEFPPPGAGDYIIHVATERGEDAYVLVSSRYVGAVDAADAAGIAVDAFAERRDDESARAVEAFAIVADDE